MHKAWIKIGAVGKPAPADPLELGECLERRRLDLSPLAEFRKIPLKIISLLLQAWEREGSPGRAGTQE